MSRRPPADEILDATASALQRVAVLLAGGVPPGSVWRYLDAAPVVVGGDGVPRPVPDASDRGGSDASASAWNAVAAAWAVATTSGAPLAPTLERFAGTMRELAQAEREVRIALAGPIATQRLVLVLPVVGLVLALALGVDPLRLLGTPTGAVCVAGGVVLLLLGRLWTSRLVRGAAPVPGLPGLDADLTAIAVSGGAPVARARALAAEAVAALGQPSEPSVDDSLLLSARAGVPAAALLRADADAARRRHVAATRIAVARLEVTLMLPLGVCVLPAFLALGVAPLVLGVLSSAMGSW